jgi:hypothetical protein
MHSLAERPPAPHAARRVDFARALFVAKSSGTGPPLRARALGTYANRMSQYHPDHEVRRPGGGGRLVQC